MRPWCRFTTGVLVAVWMVVAASPARAQEEDEPLLPDAVAAEEPDTTSASRERAAADPTFGPAIVIEDIQVVGNTSTATRLILRALPVKPGDALRAGDPRLQAARFKVLALGFFRTVDLRLEKGSRRGQVILIVEVEERGTLILNRMYFGTTVATPWWAGLDLTERNFFGTGLGLGGAFVFAGEGDADGSSEQSAFELRLEDSSVLGSRIGAHGVLRYVDASEPYRISGDPSDNSTDHFRAFDYTRTGGKAGLSYQATPLTRLDLDGRFESIDADVPQAPTRTLTDGTVVPVDLALRPGKSRLVTVSGTFDRDTRSDPVLTYDGDRIVVFAELGASWLGSHYNYGAALAKYERWWPVRSVKHVLSLHLTGGVVVGDPPLFEQLHVGDLNRLVSPRALGLVVSTTPSHDILNTSTDDVTYGRIGGVAEMQYSYRLFRSRRHVYGGDLFIGAGLWALATTDDLQVRDGSLYRALPVDLLVDVGLRLDTEIGIFELSLANALGRVPL